MQQRAHSSALIPPVVLHVRHVSESRTEEETLAAMIQSTSRAEQKENSTVVIRTGRQRSRRSDNLHGVTGLVRSLQRLKERRGPS